MKYLIYAILMILGFIILAKVTHYDERMKAHNKYMCAVYGLDETCSNPLPIDERLK